MSLKSLIPSPLRPLARAAYHRVWRGGLRLRCWWLDTFRPHEGGPPARLRFRVGESTSLDTFLTVGRRTADDLEAALRRAGRPLETCDSVLDFGCGCGRTLLWLVKQFPGKTFFGAEIDEESVRWCAAHFPAGDFRINGALPPLPYPDAAFDLVYGISVLTHWNEEYLRQWLPELGRVLKPGGVLLLTVHGEQVWRRVCPDEVERQGAVFLSSGKLRGVLPEWYQTAFYSRDYLLKVFRAQFSGVEYLPRAFGDQDAVVAKSYLPPALRS